MKKLVLIICLALIGGSCAAPGQVATNTPQQQQDSYPPFVEDTAERRAVFAASLEEVSG
ncbi:MAG: hypothetical protein KA368_20665 [Acidobacteria bacterium]|nr:hypothetical protein [Acidobacteriota bacterium]